LRPKFYRLENKTRAREELVRLYRDLSGQVCLPTGGQYWTLCGNQTARNSEIRQFRKLGLMTENQFHGVDRDTRIIATNRKVFPKAHWYVGEWEDVILHPDFQPNLVYLDTMNVIGLKPARQIIRDTILQCPPKVLLFINLMQTNPHSGLNKAPNDEEVLDNLEADLSPAILRCWEDTGGHFVYSATNATRMATYVLRRIR